MSHAFSQPADLADPNLPRLIMRLALPTIVGLSINALYHAANAVFLGLLGPEPLSAVSGAFPVLILLAAAGEGIGSGTASYVSRMLGAKRTGAASQAATTGIALSIVTGITLSAILAFSLDPILRTVGVTESALPLAHDYMCVFIIGLPLMMVQIFGNLIVISEGNTRFSMWTIVGVLALNIALDPLFIFTFGLGITGAALATLITQIIAASIYAVYFIRSEGVVGIHPCLFSLDKGILREICAVGLPVTLASSITALALALVYKTAGAYGDTAVAGIGIALRLLSLGALPVFGFCLGARAVLGFGWGAEDYGRVLNAIRFMLLVTSVFCTAYALTMLTFAPSIMSLFTDNAEVREVGVNACVAFHLLFPLLGLQVVLMTFLQAAGKAGLATLVLLAPQGYFLIPCLLLLPGIWGLSGLIASQTVAAGLTAIMAVGLMFWQVSDLRRKLYLAMKPRAVSAA